jgi:hypothetical protein
MNMNTDTADITIPVVPTVAGQVETTVEATIDTQVDANAFRPYDSQLPVPTLAGYRTVKCLYKIAKTGKSAGKAAGENSFVRIEDTITEELVTSKITELAPYLVAYLHGEQDKLVKKLHVAGMTLLSSKQYDLSMVIATLEEAGVSSRLNKEQIEEWFTGEMQDTLAVAFADKMGLSETPTDEELEKLQSILSVYKAKFGSLASGKTHYRVEEADMLLKSLDVTGAGDTTIGVRFVARLTKMKESTASSLLASL